MREVQIGALIPLSGGYGNQGDEILAALNLAVEDTNDAFEDAGRSTRVELVYADTETDPDTARAVMQSYISQDIRITIGPLTSVEVDSLKDRINSSGNVLISPSSTLTSLSIADDNIYRLVPDDSKMVQATVDVMWEQGIRSVAMFYLDNAWGQSLASLLREEFEAKGGTYIGDAAYFSSRESELKEYLGELSGTISDYMSTADPSTVAVQLISLDVGSSILELASTDATLGQVRWFGCDGFVNTDGLFLSEEGTTFAEHVEFTSPIFGSDPTDESQALSDRIALITDSTPGVYSLLAYDALAVAAEVLDDVGEDATLAEIKESLVSTFSSHSGVTGNTILNDAGDRAGGSYFFWKVIDDFGTHKWEHVFTYTDGVIE